MHHLIYCYGERTLLIYDVMTALNYDS